MQDTEEGKTCLPPLFYILSLVQVCVKVSSLYICEAAERIIPALWSVVRTRHLTREVILRHVMGEGPLGPAEAGWGADFLSLKSDHATVTLIFPATC